MLLKAGAIAAFLVLSATLTGIFLRDSLMSRQIRWTMFLESVAILVVLVSTAYGIAWFGDAVLPQDEYVVKVNSDRRVEDFISPYLNVQLYDCREVSDTFDMIARKSWAGNGNFISYSPKIRERGDGPKQPRNLGGDWYFHYNDSLIDSRMTDCIASNKRLN